MLQFQAEIRHFYDASITSIPNTENTFGIANATKCIKIPVVSTFNSSQTSNTKILFFFNYFLFAIAVT